MKRIVLALLLLSMLCGVACAEESYVRIAISGTKVNLRPQPRASGRVVAQMQEGDTFIAEKHPIVCEADDSEWYRIVLAVGPDSDRISVLSEWDSRFGQNVAFVNAGFVKAMPLKEGDAEKIAATPVGTGYSFFIDPGWGEFLVVTEDNFRFFSYHCTIEGDTSLYDKNFINEEDAKAIGRYKSDELVWLLGRDSDGIVYMVMDPAFKRLPGWVSVDDLRMEDLRTDAEPGPDITAFNAFCARDVGANIGEIAAKWGDFKVKRSAFLFADTEYVVFSTMEAPDMQVSFYEYLPDPDGGYSTPPLAIPYFRSLFTRRKGASVGGICIGVDWCNREWVGNLLGEPDTMDEDALGEFWVWYSEFSDVRIRFDDAGLVGSLSLETREAN